MTRKRVRPDDLRLLNCACCGRELLASGDDNQALALAIYPTATERPLPSEEWSRIANRPYCIPCGYTQIGKPSQLALTTGSK